MLLLGYLLLLIPVVISWRFHIPIIRELGIAVLRMSGQLFMISVVLIYLFKWDNTLVNLLWVILMVGFAAHSAVNSSGLRFRLFYAPVFGALLLSAGVILLFFNGVLLRLPDLFTAKVFVVVAGMLLGNALRGIVIGISHFYNAIRQQERRYHYHLALGATQTEALVPFFRESMLAALKPALASMATMGLVFLPGMMTGQILGGSSPDTAIKYQIAIMIVIFVAVTLSISLTILFTVRQSFDDYGILKKGIFRKE